MEAAQILPVKRLTGLEMTHLGKGLSPIYRRHARPNDAIFNGHIGRRRRGLSRFLPIALICQRLGSLPAFIRAKPALATGISLLARSRVKLCYRAHSLGDRLGVMGGGFTGIDFDEITLGIAAPFAILVALDREFFRLDAETVIFGLEIMPVGQGQQIVIAVLQVAGHGQHASAGLGVPPPLGHPYAIGLIADCNALPHIGRVADFQTRDSHLRQCQRKPHGQNDRTCHL